MRLFFFFGQPIDEAWTATSTQQGLVCMDSCQHARNWPRLLFSQTCSPSKSQASGLKEKNDWPCETGD